MENEPRRIIMGCQSGRPGVIGAALVAALAGAACCPAGNALGEDRLYWPTASEYPEHVIRCSRLDGSEAEDIVTGVDRDIRGLDIDAPAGRLYWIEKDGVESRIVRADMDGGGREPILTTEDDLSRIAVLPEENALYFTVSSSAGNAGIRRMDLESRDLIPVVSAEVYDITVDGAAGMVCWVQQGQPGTWGTDIWRAALDGSGADPIIHHSLEHHTTGIALDTEGGKIYWATIDYRAGGVQIVQRANLDGTMIEPVTTANSGLDDWPVFVALDLDDRKVYWVNGEDGEFYRAPLDGGEAEYLFEDPGSPGPFDLVIGSSPAFPSPVFRRGDSNGDGSLDLTDAVFTLEALFLATGGLSCGDAADANDDGEVDIADAIASLLYLFLGSIDIPPPGPLDCGQDPSQGDGLGCGEHASCPS